MASLLAMPLLATIAALLLQSTTVQSHYIKHQMGNFHPHYYQMGNLHPQMVNFNPQMGIFQSYHPQARNLGQFVMTLTDLIRHPSDSVQPFSYGYSNIGQMFPMSSNNYGISGSSASATITGNNNPIISTLPGISSGLGSAPGAGSTPLTMPAPTSGSISTSGSASGSGSSPSTGSTSAPVSASMPQPSSTSESSSSIRPAPSSGSVSPSLPSSESGSTPSSLPSPTSGSSPSMRPSPVPAQMPISSYGFRGNQLPLFPGNDIRMNPSLSYLPTTIDTIQQQTQQALINQFQPSSFDFSNSYPVPSPYMNPTNYASTSISAMPSSGLSSIGMSLLPAQLFSMGPVRGGQPQSQSYGSYNNNNMSPFSPYTTMSSSPSFNYPSSFSSSPIACH